MGYSYIIIQRAHVSSDWFCPSVVIVVTRYYELNLGRKSRKTVPLDAATIAINPWFVFYKPHLLRASGSSVKYPEKAFSDACSEKE